MTIDNQDFLYLLRENFNNCDNGLTRKDIKAFADKRNIKVPYMILDKSRRMSGRRGIYDIATDFTNEHKDVCVVKKARKGTTKELKPVVKYDMQIRNDVVSGSLVPKVNKLYIRHTSFSDITNILKSNMFLPVFISGMSGSGKTELVEQASASLKKDLIRVNITISTDEDDLFGGFRLVNGETKWFDGPVIQAMEIGAVLLLDEIDLASNKIMCLQPVLEGNGVFLKKVNRKVYPKPGFNILATANTKGQGNESGKFVGTTILNEALLERFAITIEQKHANESVEKKILMKLFENYNLVDDTEYINRLCKFSYAVRKAYENHSIDDIISTRRLVHIIKSYAIFRDEDKAFNLCISRFDASVRVAFKQLWKGLSEPEPDSVDDLLEPGTPNLYNAG